MRWSSIRNQSLIWKYQALKTNSPGLNKSFILLNHWMSLFDLALKVGNLQTITHGDFWQKHIFWTFWTFSTWYKRHESMPFFLLASRFMTLLLGHAHKSKYFFFRPLVFLLSLSFCCSCRPSTGLASNSMIPEKASSRREILTKE